MNKVESTKVVICSTLGGVFNFSSNLYGLCDGSVNRQLINTVFCFFTFSQFLFSFIH